MPAQPSACRHCSYTHSEALADLLLQVSNQWVVEVTHTALLTVSLDPSQMAELGVHGHTQDLSVNGLELAVAV